MRLASLAIATVFAGVGLDVAFAAAERPIEELPRTAPWVARFDENACHLIGQFGTGKEQVSIRLSRYAADDSFDLTLYGDRFSTTDAFVQGGVTFSPESKIVKGDLIAGTVGKTSMLIVGRTRLDGWRRAKETDEAPVVSPSAESEVSSLDFQIGGRRRVRLLTGSMGKPMVTMRSCMDGLIKHWGFDPVVEATLSRRLTAIGSPGSWLNSSDYPKDALDGGHNGIVQFRVDVDATGKVEKCNVLAATKPSDFELATCKGISKRARFVPALDAKGAAVRSFYVNTVKWIMWH